MYEAIHSAIFSTCADPKKELIQTVLNARINLKIYLLFHSCVHVMMPLNLTGIKCMFEDCGIHDTHK